MMDVLAPQKHGRMAGRKRVICVDENVHKFGVLAGGRPGGKQANAARNGFRRAALGDVSNVLAERNAGIAKGKAANISKRTAQKPTSTAVSAAAAMVALQRAKAKNAPAKSAKGAHVDAVVPSETRVAQEIPKPVKPDLHWKNLDLLELDEPLTCAEYAPEIFQYLRELEPGTMPNPMYCEHQNDVNYKIRDVLLDWMVEVHQNFKMMPETLYLAINILDRYLSLIQVPRHMLQLAGVTALFIAAKVEEIVIPEIKEFAYMADNAYLPEHIRRAERHMLHTINFRLSYPNPMNFLRRISKADDYDMLSRTVGKYLMEIALVDHRFMGFAPSLAAAGAMYLARHILNRGKWDTTLAHYAGYSEAEILPVVTLMVAYISEPIHESLFKKYANKKFSKVSIMVHDWYKRRTT